MLPSFHCAVHTATLLLLICWSPDKGAVGSEMGAAAVTAACGELAIMIAHLACDMAAWHVSNKLLMSKNRRC